MEKKLFFENRKQYDDVMAHWDLILDAASKFVSEFARVKLGNITKEELNRVANRCHIVAPLGRQDRVRDLFKKKYESIAVKALYLNDIPPALHKNIIAKTIDNDLGELGVIGAELQLLCEELDEKIFDFERVTIDWQNQSVTLPETERLKIKEEFCSVFISSEKQEKFAALLESAADVLNQLQGLSKMGENVIPEALYFEGGAWYVYPYAVNKV